MDAMDDRVGPEPPVRGGPEAVLVQRAPPQQGPAARRAGSAGTGPASRRGSRRGAAGGSRRAGSTPASAAGLLVTANRSSRGSSQTSIGSTNVPGGELAAPDRADAGPLDPGADRVGHARAEDPVVGRVEVGEADDVPPDRLGRGVDHHRGLAGEEQGLGRRRRARRPTIVGRSATRTSATLPRSPGRREPRAHDAVADHRPEQRDRHGERQHHDDADQPLEGGRDQHDDARSGARASRPRGTARA